MNGPATAPTTAPGKAPGTGILIGLAVIAALGSMAIHMLVPALPAMAGQFAVSVGAAQLAVSIYMIALGGGQLVAGPAADRLGRRPVLIAGIALYVLGALICAAAPVLWVLLIGRAIQASGGAAGVVTSRVLVGDIFGKERAAERQATLMMVILISPALAPVLGGFLAQGPGWRSIPLVLAAGGVIAATVVLRRLPTGATPVGRVEQRSLWQDARRVARNRQLALTALAMAGATSVLYMFLANAVFLLVRDMGLTERDTGLCLLAIAAVSIFGTRLVRPVQKRGCGLLAGTALVLAGAGIELAVELAGWHGPVALVAPMLLVGVGAGLAGPSAMAIIVFAEEGLAGTAASLAGAFQMLASALCTMALGFVSPMTPLRLALALVLAAAVSATAAGLRWRLATPARGLTPRA
ncbi:MFS transporter [Novosphingobium sp. FSY-8]|uniref:MFS transporter n=1 Tax=Novosphingobium ovatum TaxID=1908523 RepID=A0ABW9XC08_9SPHN|nr:MFS transporter [Novosphingobium ovatum]NBC36048.1 MFS transporter [Novosphingobium ovatum]